MIPRERRPQAVRPPYNRIAHREARRQERANPTPCTRETPRCNIATSYQYELPACCRGHVRSIVHTVGDAMTQAGVRWWLDYGSLLGAVRNPMLQLPGGIIPHDKDADLGFLGEDWDKLLGIVSKWTPAKAAGGVKDNEVGEALGFWWIHKFPRRQPKRGDLAQYGAGDSLKVCLSDKNRSNSDIFPWYDRPREGKPDGKRRRYHYVGCDRNKGREFPESMLLPLGEMEWEGKLCPVPADPEWMVEHRYGKNWRVPLRKNNNGTRVR